MVVKFIVSRARSAVQVKSNTGDETTKIQGNSVDYGSTVQSERLQYLQKYQVSKQGGNEWNQPAVKAVESTKLATVYREVGRARYINSTNI